MRIAILTPRIGQKPGVRFFGLLAALCCVAAVTRGDELHLRNGDRITGEVVRRTSTTVVFKSPILGELTLPLADVTIIPKPETPVESLTGLPPLAPAADGKPPAKALPKASAATAKSPDPATAATAKAPAPAPAAKPPALSPGKAPWKGKAEFGFQQQSGRRNTVNLTIRTDIERSEGRNNYRGSVRYLYAEQNDRPSSDRIDASFRYRRQLSERVFAQTQGTYFRDRLKGVDQNYEQNVGMGYRLWQKPRHVINVGAGMTAQYREDIGASEAVAGFGEFFQDYSYKINGRLTFLQDSIAQYSPSERTITSVSRSNRLGDGEVNYKVRFNTALQGKMSERVSLNLRFEYEFDNAILAEDAKTDQRITSSLGYSF